MDTCSLMKGLCGLRSAPPNSALSFCIMSFKLKVERSTDFRMCLISFFKASGVTCSGVFFNGRRGAESSEDSDSDASSSPPSEEEEYSSSEESSASVVGLAFFLAFFFGPSALPFFAAAEADFFFFFLPAALFLFIFFLLSMVAKSLSDITLGLERKSKMRFTLPPFFASSPFPLGRSNVSRSKFSSSTVKPASLFVSFSSSA
mmetsp:Transcript_3208/g.9503  ORF Transcript_3208/g.9503 Transcript_3208/m.9503 type:complete len:203 (-) Transcript_3208:577-1185(-)